MCNLPSSESWLKGASFFFHYLVYHDLCLPFFQVDLLLLFCAFPWLIMPIHFFHESSVPLHTTRDGVAACPAVPALLWLRGSSPSMGRSPFHTGPKCDAPGPGCHREVP